MSGLAAGSNGIAPSVRGRDSKACVLPSTRHPGQALSDHVSMTDFLAGYVIPPGAGVAGDPSLKASQRSTGGALSVFETTIGAAHRVVGSNE
jgi:hypothetical protein